MIKGRVKTNTLGDSAQVSSFFRWAINAIVKAFPSWNQQAYFHSGPSLRLIIFFLENLNLKFLNSQLWCAYWYSIEMRFLISLFSLETYFLTNVNLGVPSLYNYCVAIFTYIIKKKAVFLSGFFYRDNFPFGRLLTISWYCNLVCLINFTVPE